MVNNKRKETESKASDSDTNEDILLSLRKNQPKPSAKRNKTSKANPISSSSSNSSVPATAQVVKTSTPNGNPSALRKEKINKYSIKTAVSKASNSILGNTAVVTKLQNDLKLSQAAIITKCKELSDTELELSVETEKAERFEALYNEAKSRLDVSTTIISCIPVAVREVLSGNPDVSIFCSISY
jgi:hypothetical protein